MPSFISKAARLLRGNSTSTSSTPSRTGSTGSTATTGSTASAVSAARRTVGARPASSSSALTWDRKSRSDGDDGSQTIPMSGGMNEWKLRCILENTFEPGQFRIEMRSDSYKVWAPRQLEKKDFARFRRM